MNVWFICLYIRQTWRNRDSKWERAFNYPLFYQPPPAIWVSLERKRCKAADPWSYFLIALWRDERGRLSTQHCRRFRERTIKLETVSYVRACNIWMGRVSIEMLPCYEAAPRIITGLAIHSHPLSAGVVQPKEENRGLKPGRGGCALGESLSTLKYTSVLYVCISKSPRFHAVR